MRICHITSMHNWDDDRIYQRACIGLAREGHDVHLVATRPSDIPNEEGVHFHWVTSRSGWKRRWLSSREAIDKAITVTADIYHFHDPDLLPHITNLKAQNPKSVVIYDIHENYAGRFQNWGLPVFLGEWFRWYEKNIINKIDGYTTVSHSMQRLFKDVKKPSAVVRNSTDMRRLKDVEINNAKSYEPPAIYTSGTNSHARHCLQTVEAIKYIDPDLSYQVLFAGKYAPGLKGELEKKAENDKTSKYLKLEGLLPWEQNFLRTSKAFAGCVFYEDNPNNRVGIPNRLFEYMYCGLPVIASNFPELKRIVTDTNCGIIVNSENPRSIAQGIEYLLKNPQEAHDMGRRGLIAVEKEYGYHVDLNRMLSFYESIL